MRLASKVGGRRVALLAGAVLPLSYLFYDKARTSQIDSLLCDAEILVVAHEAALPSLEPQYREDMPILCSTRLSRRDLQLLRFSPGALEVAER